MKSVYKVNCTELSVIALAVMSSMCSTSESVISGVSKAYMDIMMGDHSAATASQVSEIKARLANEKARFDNTMQVLKSAAASYSDAESSLISKAMIGTLLVRKWDEVGVGAAKAYFKTELSLMDKLALIFGILPVVFTADTFKTVSDTTKDETIKRYEDAHPDAAKSFERVLSDSDLTDDERRDIKFMTYSAPEPYRTIYMEHIDEYIVDVDTSFTINYRGKDEVYYNAFYWSGDGKIHLIDGDDTFLNNPRGPYNTVFHESGHAIDDYEVGAGSLSNSFTYEGKTLNEIITSDVRNYVKDYIKEQYPDLLKPENAGDYRTILRSLNLDNGVSFAPKGDTSELRFNNYLGRIRSDIVSHMQTDLSGRENHPASDVYGGVTNNAIYANYGHSAGNGYWYDGTTPTGAQERELWAEFFAAKMTHDEAQLASIRKHFPTAYEAMEEMAKQMAKSR